MKRLVLLLGALLLLTSPVAAECALRTSGNAHLIFPETLSDRIPAGEEVAVYSKAGLCCGKTVWKSGAANVITVWEDDYMTNAVDGIAAGESFLLRSGADAYVAVSDGEIPFYATNAFYIADSFESSASIGFTATASSVNEDASVSVPITLTNTLSTPIQGIQIDITSNGPLSFSSVSTSAAVSGWTVSSNEVAPGQLRVILFSSTESLSAGTYTDLVTLSYDAASVSADTDATLSLSGAIGSLATASGGDAGLTLSSSSHTVTVRDLAPAIAVSATTLDLGSVTAGASASGTFTVTNNGTAALLIPSAASDNDLFTVSPANASIAAGASETYTVTLNTRRTLFGSENAVITLSHNAGSDVVVSAEALLENALGEISGDGTVDISDLTAAVDAALTVRPYGAAVDTYPFPAGDGSVDVRDITVLANAIVGGAWPNGDPLPAAALGKGAGGSTLFLEETTNGTEFALDAVGPIRGIELEFQTASFDSLSTGGDVPAGTIVNYNYQGSTLRLLIYRLDGRALDTPSVLALAQGAYDVKLLRGVAVAGDNERITLVGKTRTATGIEDDELPRSFVVGPYPNPFNPSTQIEVHLERTQQLEATVYDVRGRRVKTLNTGPLSAGRHSFSFDATGLPSGLYFVRIIGETFQKHVTASLIK